MSKSIRIGTRDSRLAMWQAGTVAQKLSQAGYSTEIVPVKSAGDIILDKPLYELGITGIFTKTLDLAMLSGTVDIAVHSMKDVPTVLPEGIVQAAVIERGNPRDLLLYKDNLDFLQAKGDVATGSLRRNAQWLNRFPEHTMHDLRGNVLKRLQKLNDNDWNAAIFAAAGLERLGINPPNAMALDWMIPAPAQGAMVVVALENDRFSREALAPLNDKKTETATRIERQFLQTLEGGCTAPIGAFAEFKDEETVFFRGILLSVDGKKKVETAKELWPELWDSAGKNAALEVLANGGSEIMEELRK